MAYIRFRFGSGASREPRAWQRRACTISCQPCQRRVSAQDQFLSMHMWIYVHFSPGTSRKAQGRPPMSCGHIFHWANESLCLLAQGGQNVANWVILCPQTVGRRARRASLALFARSCSRPRQLVRWRLLVNKRGPVSGTAAFLPLDTCLFFISPISTMSGGKSGGKAGDASSAKTQSRSAKAGLQFPCLLYTSPSPRD